MTWRIRERLESRVQDPTGIAADDAIGPVGHRHRSFRRAPERETWDPQERGFFLDTTGVGQHEACSAYERDKIEVAEWIHIRDALTAETIRGLGCDTAASLVGEALLDTRVYRKHDRDVTGQCLESLEEIREDA